MNVTEALAYIHSVSWKGSIPGLSRTQELLAKMGNPEKHLRFIHVAGTNGKGSTAAMLASIFQTAGYTTGLYTSPYISRFHERMQVNGIPISDSELSVITEAVRPLAESMEDHPTEFELVSCIAFEYFFECNCDIVVLEVGMGGELDSTNVIPTPEAAVICNIGLDHMEVLGDTLEKIASAKAGIIKKGGDVITYREKPSVEKVFEDRCEKVGAHLHKADFDTLRPVLHTLDGQVFDWGRFPGLRLPLLGVHQLRNAAVALTTATVLQAKGWKLSDSDIRDGLANVSWPGRFQVLRRDPLFIADGGHNPQCIEALTQNIRDYLPDRPLTVLTGVMADKDYDNMYASVAPFAKEFIAVTPLNPRALPAEKLAAYLTRFGKPVSACLTVYDGVRAAIEHAGPDGTVLSYGSLYMMGDVMAAVKQSIL
jgi:dihydrofolate synthase/folylpolyglutamate synthase